MTGRIDIAIEFRRTLSRGPAAVYVLPHRSEEFLKLGFSRDPLARMQNLHPRYFDFFDIERAIIIQTPSVKEARALETALKRQLAVHRAPAPLDIRHVAGGESEWYRGAYDAIVQRLIDFEELGYSVFRDSKRYFKERLRDQSATVYEWASLHWRAVNEGETWMVERAQRALINVLDAYEYFEIDIADLVPTEIAEWYRKRC